MQHCVATYLGEVLAGTSHIASAEVLGDRLTIQVLVTPLGLELGQVSGPCNRPPTAAQLKVLRRWLRGVRAAHGEVEGGPPGSQAVAS
jgi:hypothetical protein